MRPQFFILPLCNKYFNQYNRRINNKGRLNQFFRPSKNAKNFGNDTKANQFLTFTKPNCIYKF